MGPNKKMKKVNADFQPSEIQPQLPKQTTRPIPNPPMYTMPQHHHPSAHQDRFTPTSASNSNNVSKIDRPKDIPSSHEKLIDRRKDVETKPVKKKSEEKVRIT